VLFALCIDRYDSDFVVQNYAPFKEDLLVLDRASDSTYDENDIDIKELFKELGSDISINSLVDENDNKLPTALTEEQARIIRRDLGIDNILS